jgi:hypothetical protein
MSKIMAITNILISLICAYKIRSLYHNRPLWVSYCSRLWVTLRRGLRLFVKLEAAFWGTLQSKIHHAWYNCWSTERFLHHDLTWTTGHQFNVNFHEKQPIIYLPITTKAIACTCGQVFYEQEPGDGQELIGRWIPEQQRFFSEV